MPHLLVLRSLLMKEKPTASNTLRLSSGPTSPDLTTFATCNMTHRSAVDTVHSHQPLTSSRAAIRSLSLVAFCKCLRASATAIAHVTSPNVTKRAKGKPLPHTCPSVLCSETAMDLESVFDTAVSGDRQGKGASVWQAEVALRLSKPRAGVSIAGWERAVESPSVLQVSCARCTVS